MSDYNQYVTAINKIFDHLAKMKAGWDNIDNMNYIESIEEYRHIVATSATAFKASSPQKLKKEPTETLEALGDDW